MNQLRKTIGLILGLLNESDRLALVGFNNSAQQLFKLQAMTPSNKKTIIDILCNILPMGLTNIARGLLEGLKILHSEGKNQPGVPLLPPHRVRSLFLLSDGVDDRCEDNLEMFRQEIASIPVEFSLHTFGYGDDERNTGVLRNIAEFKQGNFYFVEDIQNTDIYFADALGDLFAIVSSQARFTFTINCESPPQHTAVTFAGVYGDMWNDEDKVPSNSSGDSHRIREFTLNQLFAGVKKQVFFEVTIEASPSFSSSEDILVVLGEGKLTVEGLDCETIHRSQEVVITIGKERGVESVEVKASFLRACGAKALQSAIDLSLALDYEGGSAVLERALLNLNEEHFPEYPSFPELLSLRRDILDCLDNITRRLCTSTNNSLTQLSCSTSHSTRECDLLREAAALKISRAFLGKSKSHMEQKSIMIELDEYRSVVQKTVLREITLARSAAAHQSLVGVEGDDTIVSPLRKSTFDPKKRKGPLLFIQRKKFASMNVALDADLSQIQQQD